MYCPNHKKNTKQKKLQTVRTINDKEGVKRERVCPVCKKRFWTIELFQDNYDETIRVLQHKVWEAESDKYSAERRIAIFKEAFDNIIYLPGEK